MCCMSLKHKHNDAAKLWNLHCAQEGVAFTLGADGGDGSVAREYFGFVREGQQAGLDGVDDLIEVSAGEVGSADAAGE